MFCEIFEPICKVLNANAEYILAGASFVYRIAVKPKLHAAPHDNNSKDVSRSAILDDLSVDIYRLRILNTGNQRLLNPRAWLIGVVSQDRENPKRYNPQDIIPFELSWSETDRDVQIGILLEGNLNYRIDLFAVIKSRDKSKKTSAILNQNDDNSKEEVLNDQVRTFKFGDLAYDLMGRNTSYQDEPTLHPDVAHRLGLIISNENFLVPSYFIELEIKPNSDYTAPVINLIYQDDHLTAKIERQLDKFQNGFVSPY